MGRSLPSGKTKSFIVGLFSIILCFAQKQHVLNCCDQIWSEQPGHVHLCRGCLYQPGLAPVKRLQLFT